VGFVLPEPALLEMLPALSTPEIVNEYELLGVTPFGVYFCGEVLPHAGISKSVPLSTKRPTSPQAFLDRFPPAAAPRPTSASIGKGSHSAQKDP
jgi:hypothetical protein